VLCAQFWREFSFSYTIAIAVLGGVTTGLNYINPHTAREDVYFVGGAS